MGCGPHLPDQTRVEFIKAVYLFNANGFMHSISNIHLSSMLLHVKPTIMWNKLASEVHSDNT